MASRRTSRQVLRNCQLILTSTEFDDAGDFVTSKMNIDTSTLTLSVYTRRHICTKGNFTLSFPGTSTPSEYRGLTEVFPSKDSYELSGSSFVVTAGEPGSVYYCVIPAMPGDTIKQTEITINPNDVITLPKRSVNFVYCEGYVLNGLTNTNSVNVLACENTSATIVAQTTGTIVQFGVTQF